jgi:hypothetical protein
MTKFKTTPITGRMIRAVRNLYCESSGGWPIRMERNGQVAVYPAKNPYTGHHHRLLAISPVKIR